jgi:hypothetical protein
MKYNRKLSDYESIQDMYIDMAVEKCEKEKLDFVITDVGVYIIKICPYCKEDRYIGFLYRKQRQGYCSVACNTKAHSIGIKRTIEQRKKMSESKLGNIPWNKDSHIQTNTGRTHFKKGHNMGSSHPNWRNGLSFEPYGIEFNKTLKEKIRKRDNYLCQECKVNQKELGYKLHIHHIDYNKQNNSENNLISLCRSCHCQTTWNRDDWKEYYKNMLEYNHKTALLMQL